MKTSELRKRALRARRENSAEPKVLSTQHSALSTHHPPDWVAALHRHWLAAGEGGRRMAAEHLHVAAHIGNVPLERAIAALSAALHSLCFAASEAMLIAVQLVEPRSTSGVRLAAGLLAAELAACEQSPIASTHDSSPMTHDSSLITHPTTEAT